MIDKATYPFSIPLSREHALAIATDPSIRAAVPGSFLTFVMIPVEERIGEWRFAGASRSLGQALQRVGEFVRRMGACEKESETMLSEWLQSEAMEVWTDLSQSWSYGDLPIKEIGKHRVILFLEGQAPYDDAGACVLEIESLDGSLWAERNPETERPATWAERDPEEDGTDEGGSDE